MSYLIKGEDYLEARPGFRLVGRDSEFQRLSAILTRSRSNSVLLTGMGGVGCTALCMGLQWKKLDPHAPLDVISKRLFWLDSDGLFSSGNQDEVNAAFARAIRVLEETPDSVLIIEDTKDFIEAARNNGSMHFINAIVNLIKRKSTQVILEVRDDDLDMVLKAHSDMRELFTMIELDEPTGEHLRAMVEDGVRSLEEFHKIKVDPDAITAAIDLTTKYRTRGGNRAQPERSITLLDRALATYRLHAHPHVGDDDQAKIRLLHSKQRALENVILSLEDELEDELKRPRDETPPTQETRRQAFSRLASGAGIEGLQVQNIKTRLRGAKELALQTKGEFDQLTAEINRNLLLDRDMVVAEFGSISGIPVSKLNQDEREKLKGLEASLKTRIFGQDHVLKKVADAVKTARVGRRSPDKPQAAFMFLGPSGVGKTEMAKALAAALLDDERALTRFDMSEYMEKHAVAKLIGAPPGYEGFEAGGILTNALRRNPVRVLLFDEIEKAHPDVFNVFLQILSDGRLTDNVGRTVSFADSVIVMTTNIGQPHFLNQDLSFDEAREEAIKDLNQTYRSEFLNRFSGRQNIVCFNALDKASIEKIVDREIRSIDSAYRVEGINIFMEDSEIREFVDAHYDPAIGARGLPGYIQANLEPTIVDGILSGIRDKKVKVDWESPPGFVVSWT